MTQGHGTGDGDAGEVGRTVRLSGLRRSAPSPVDWRPGGDALRAIAMAAGARTLRKVRLAGALVPEGRADWRFEGRIGATAVQACAVTLEDVTTRIDAPVLRLYRADGDGEAGAPGAEVEMTDGAEAVEPLPDTLDLAALAVEALALELPDYPRADGAEGGPLIAGPPGAEPLTDEAARPFAGLAALRARMADGEEG